MYEWRKMTAEQQQEVLAYRKLHGRTWHYPHHRGTCGAFHITAACFEHRPFVGTSVQRMVDWEQQLAGVIADQNSSLHAWCVLPNHYHLLVNTRDIKPLLRALGKLHGRLSHTWNGEEGKRGAGLVRIR